MAQWVDAATIRGARAAVIVCAIALSLLVVASLRWPALVFWSPERDLDRRLLLALVIGMPLSLALALRDPVRNAGVFAVIGLGCGFLSAARAMNFLVPEIASGTRVYVQGNLFDLWLVGTILFFAIAVTLVGTYSRLRRPHPIVVRVVIAATVFLPLVLWLYDSLALAFR